ncbi:hypothetical protein K4A83_10265 [Spirulina subsalsa FACHB-351]|uniref:Uncharacterized protein n=1 Tax=Spirulina subsalsa FACHB-351 TaxID=234711 RepID=A0ABT3L573_9CYAN|nr:hypothetical protein [Spirulina subsalsa]MCW6036644.1 hypothetical protein [Spirulina subsalsa FACHB-351]
MLSNQESFMFLLTQNIARKVDGLTDSVSQFRSYVSNAATIMLEILAEVEDNLEAS